MTCMHTPKGTFDILVVKQIPNRKQKIQETQSTRTIMPSTAFLHTHSNHVGSLQPQLHTPWILHGFQKCNLVLFKFTQNTTIIFLFHDFDHVTLPSALLLPYPFSRHNLCIFICMTSRIPNYSVSVNFHLLSRCQPRPPLCQGQLQLSIFQIPQINPFIL